MTGLFSDLAGASSVQRAPKDSSGAAISQLDILPRSGGGYVAVYVVAGGVALADSADLRLFRRRGTFEQGGVAAPVLAAVTGGGAAAAGLGKWWVLAFETGLRPPGPSAAAAAPVVAACDGYLVSGAGVAGANGCYVRQRNRYVKDATHSIYPFNFHVVRLFVKKTK